MMGVWSWLKSNFLLLHIFYVYVNLASGLIVSCLMLLSYLLIWPINKTFYRKIVANLVYVYLCHFTFLFQWWSNSDFTLYLENPKDINYIGNEHMLLILNHKYELDQFVVISLAERWAMLSGSKTFAKSSIKFIPVIGWTMWFTESLFLERNWNKDKEILQRNVNCIQHFPDSPLMMLTLCCEGTRYTKGKHELSRQFAKNNGLPILRHHLTPRTKGFVYFLHEVYGKFPAILDMTVAFTKDSAPSTLTSLFRGKKCQAEIYVRRIPLTDVPVEPEQACADWLHKLYQEKDDIFDNFVQNGRYTIGEKVDIPRRQNDLIIVLMWVLFLGLPLWYFSVQIFLSSSMTLKICSAVIALLVFFSLYFCYSICQMKQCPQDDDKTKQT